MSTITLCADEQGNVDGFTEQDRIAYARFNKKKKNMAPGELIFFSTWFERSGPFHRRHMRMLRDVFEGQDNFTDFNAFRKWTEAGAGHGEFIQGEKGLVFVPSSIAYHEIDQVQMEELHAKVKDFFRSQYALNRLWGHLGPYMQAEVIEQLLGGYG